MRVLTVNNEEFRELCLKLKSEILASGFDYDVVVAIARAGIFVAHGMNINKFFTVSCHREGASVKKNWVGSILRKLPAGVNIFLRKIEYRLLLWRDRSVNYSPRLIAMSPELKALLEEGEHKVLILDDAVDSGRSLKSVRDEVERIGSGNILRTAVITVTRDKTVITPDYALFKNCTLIRFPWSEDVKKK